MAHLKLSEIEDDVRAYWEKNGIYRQVVEARKGAKKYYFCQGPPFTSGYAHLGHAWNHALKDFVIRYQTMRGCDVFRRAGWDMHGLPIEVKVEETVLGSRSKKEIEEYGIDNFIAECKKFAIRNMNAMTGQIKLLGAWLDWDDPYMTLDRRYMESVWYGIKKAHEKDLLYQDKQVIHWCPRCETAVAGYEVKDEYREVSDPSVYVKAKLAGRDEYMLIWTTTPWTLPANTGIAVNPEFKYAKVKYKGDVLIFAKERVAEVLKKGYEIVGEVSGSDLEGLSYEPILDIPLQKGISRTVVTAPELVLITEGTGCVHIAPGHGEEDFKVGKEHGLSSLSPVDEAGKLTAEPYKGTYIRDANPVIIEDLRKSSALLRDEKILHRYPHCWRCKTPLLLRSTKQWFLAVSKIRDDLLEKNKNVTWVPEWIGSGRFENWLTNARDWCISRQRYWNTPLPVWVCECDKIEVIGSIAELKEKASGKVDAETIDLHRPHIDKVALKCSCGKEMKRVKDVLDVWIDSGSASWANLGYPHDKKRFEEWFPVDFITEGSDQTRGWFYSLLVMSTIAFGKAPYKKVLYHGFTLDSKGQKMSKSLGNVVDPVEVVKTHGADPFRFYMLWTSVPWDDLCFSEEGLTSVERTFNILLNVYGFFETYMQLDKYDPKKKYEIELQQEDLWVLSRYNSLIATVTEAAEKTHPHEFCRPINDFILELSRWYVKLIRDRVWIAGEDPRKMSVYYTLHTVLSGLSVLMAPVTPHLSEHLYRKLNVESSVHLCDWPEPDEKMTDAELEKGMGAAMKIVECVQAARQEADIKLRWPIARVVVALKPDADVSITNFENVILKLSNAKALEFKDVKAEVSIKPNPGKLGPKYKKDAQKVIEALKALGSEEAAKLRDEVEKKGSGKAKGFEISAEDVSFESRVPEDIVAEEFEYGVVYIDSKMNPQLISESMAREVVRRIQQMRKDLNLEELSVVSAAVGCDGEFRKYVEENLEFIEGETRTKITLGAPKDTGYSKEWDIEGSTVTLSLKK